ncbi:MAG: polysaccharide biosynthesis protein [Clostridia bacterium]|nr:polysaccharide biosynthesis protein [Clostridia bacterium]
MGDWAPGMLLMVLYSSAIFAVVMFFLLYIFKVYNILWRYSGVKDHIRIFLSSLFAILVVNIVQRALWDSSFTKTVWFAVFFFSASSICCSRLYVKYRKRDKKPTTKNLLSGNIMVIGAGFAGSELINDINVSKNFVKCTVKCVIDDNPYKWDKYIDGVRIVGGCDKIVEAAEKYDIDMIVFSIPACPSDRKAEILKICQQTDCEIRVVPSMYQLLTDKNVGISSIRKVEIEDLLGRDTIDINVTSVMDYVEGQVVLITGGGGSIGSELCRQIASHNPKQLIIFDIYENNAYDIQNELLEMYPELNLVTLIGSVRDKERLENVFKKYKPDLVYHAAAHKHVPLMEFNPNESIKNNVFGTANTAFFADKYCAKKFILISTDKAVNPTNIMGASKRICEMIVQGYNNHSKTEFVAVRFGNVLGSNGSVIPLFKKQIANGGPVTVTDPNIIRYFMTIPEAVSLVLQAGASAKGGEIFVLDMGKPMKIIDLAENLIKLSGYVPYKDIQIEFTGLRPGEKLYEEMLMSEEGLTKTANRLIYIGHHIDFDEEKLKVTLEKMHSEMYDENANIRELVADIVPTYTYTK